MVATCTSSRLYLNNIINIWIHCGCELNSVQPFCVPGSYYEQRANQSHIWEPEQANAAYFVSCLKRLSLNSISRICFSKLAGSFAILAMDAGQSVETGNKTRGTN